MYKFTGWMLPTGALFDRYAVRDWSGAQVQTSKYFSASRQARLAT